MILCKISASIIQTNRHIKSLVELQESNNKLIQDILDKNNIKTEAEV